jgi:hypothetical protein
MRNVEVNLILRKSAMLALVEQNIIPILQKEAWKSLQIGSAVIGGLPQSVYLWRYRRHIHFGTPLYVDFVVMHATVSGLEKKELETQSSKLWSGYKRSRICDSQSRI